MSYLAGRLEMFGNVWNHGMDYDYDFPFSWEFHHPNWRTHVFQRGGSTTNQLWSAVCFFSDFSWLCYYNYHWFSNIWWSPPVFGKACDASQEDQVVALSLGNGLYGLKHLTRWPPVMNFGRCGWSSYWENQVEISGKWVVWGLGWGCSAQISGSCTPPLWNSLSSGLAMWGVRGWMLNMQKLLSCCWSCLQSDPFGVQYPSLTQK